MQERKLASSAHFMRGGGEGESVVGRARTERRGIDLGRGILLP